MNSQEIFNTVARHLLEQGERSVYKGAVGHTYCAYRSPDGLKCAIGVLIPDNLYDKSFEKTSVTNFGDDILNLLLPDDLEYYAGAVFLENLQSIHDYGDPKMWDNDLREFAEEYDLDPSVIYESL